MDMTATNVNALNIVRSVMPAAAIPDFLAAFISPISFASVKLSYDSTSKHKRSKFAVTAVPDVSRSGVLKALIEGVGLDPKDLALRLGPDTLVFGVSKRYEVALPAPFTGPGYTGFDLALDAKTKGAVLAGTFSAALKLPGVEAPVGVAVGASASLSAANGLAFGLSGEITTPVSLKDFPFVRLNALRLSAAMSVSPTTLTEFTLAGKAELLGVTGSGVISFDKASGAMAYAIKVSNIDLQQMLGAMGINVNLGVLNLRVDEVVQSYATVDIPGLDIEAGCYIAGRFNFLGMNADIGFKVNTDGISLRATFDTQEFSRVFNEEVLGRVDRAIQAAGDWMKGAGSTLNQAKQKAIDELENARAAVDSARADVEAARAAFDQAQDEAQSALQAAQDWVNEKLRLFDEAKASANAAFDDAQRSFQDADAAFEYAKQKAYSDLENAKRAVNDAQANYDREINGAMSSVNSAQAEVNKLWGEYEYYNSRCDGWPWNWPNCVAAGGAWTAYQVATGVLEAAKGFLDTVARGAGWGVLEGARQSLSGFQAVADAVLTGTEWGTRQAAWVTLEGARAVVNGIMDSAEGVAWVAANGALEAAKLAANAVLEGAEWVTYNTAQLALTAADGTLAAAQGVADAALTALEFAVNSVGEALSWIKISGILEFNSFEFRLAAGPETLSVGVSFDIAVAQIPLSGSLDLDLSNPLNMIAQFLERQALQVVKQTFPPLEPFLP